MWSYNIDYAEWSKARKIFKIKSILNAKRSEAKKKLYIIP